MQINGAKTYTWDARNRLTAIGGAAPASFAYDVADRRIAKTSPITSNINTQITFDGANPVLEKQGTTVTGANLTGLGIDSYLARTDGTTETYPLTDHLGNVIALTDTTGNIGTTYVYEPYGATTQTGAPSTNPHQYTGRESDGTGLYYYRARYYDPQLMRFISEDPIGLAGGVNAYGYVGGNPVSYRDPLGLWSVSFGFFWGLGGEVSFGKDANTCQGFMGLKLGVGGGVGAKWDPTGSIPGSLPNSNPQTSGITTGLFADVDFNAGPIQASLQNNGGLYIPVAWSSRIYVDLLEPKVSFGNSWGLKAGAAAGGEIS